MEASSMEASVEAMEAFMEDMEKPSWKVWELPPDLPRILPRHFFNPNRNCNPQPWPTTHRGVIE